MMPDNLKHRESREGNEIWPKWNACCCFLTLTLVKTIRVRGHTMVLEHSEGPENQKKSKFVR